jgi:hypothetical protein
MPKMVVKIKEERPETVNDLFCFFIWILAEVERTKLLWD